MPPRVHRVTLGDPESDPEVDNGYISVNSHNQHNRSSGGRQQSRGGVQTRGNTVEVTLGDVNPYDTRSDNRNRGSGHRSHHNDRDQGRHHHHSRRPPSDDDEDQDDDDQGHEEDGVVSLPTVNPFARGGGGNGNSNRNANTGRNSNTGRNTSQPISRQRASQPPPRQQVVSESDSEEETDDDGEQEEAPPPPTARTRAGAVPFNSRLLQQAATSTTKGSTKPPTIGAPESKQQARTIPGPSKAAVADSDEDSDEDSEEDSEEEHTPVTGNGAGKKPVSGAPEKDEDDDSETESDDDDGLGVGPHAVPTDPKAKGKGKEGASAKGKGKEAGPSGAKKSANDKVNISTSDSWSGEVGRPEGFDHHHHHHHRHRPKREYPAADYRPDPDFFETSSSSTSTTSSSSDSSSSFDCDCPRGKHLHRCRFRREREREFDCDCPHGKHHRHCRHHHRYHSRHERERDREHAWEREHMRGREYGFDCDCRGGFHHQHCPFWRRPPHFHGHHHRGPNPWDQPPWWPYPFPPMITQLDHKRNPFGEPLYANIPELPSLFDQVKDAYYTLPVPPTNLLRDLQEMQRRNVPKEAEPAPQDPPKESTWLKFATGLPAIAKEKDYLSAVPAILYQQLHTYYVDMIYNRLQSMVQVRFAERKGEKIINRVHVVQRYRTAWNAVMSYRPKLDVDIVIPGDFVLRRWCISPQAKDEEKPKTISKAMGLDPTRVIRGEIDQDKLDWVIKAVWEQLNGKADGFIFPGGNVEALQYVGSFKDLPPQPGAWRIKLQSVGLKTSVWINLFVKVAIRVNGQDMVVGVDQTSAVSENKYQMAKLYHTPNGPLGESPLGPIEQIALIMLGWWKRDTKQGDPPKVPGGMKIRGSHFSLALKACRELDPTDELYISPGTGREQFSIQRSVAVALKLAKYLKLAYSSPVLVCASKNAKTTKPDQAQMPAMQFLFPLGSCGILEAVYTQMISVTQKPPLDELVKKFDELIGILEGAKGGDEKKDDEAGGKKDEGKDTKDGDVEKDGGDATGKKSEQSTGAGGSGKTGAAETPEGANPPAQGDPPAGQSDDPNAASAPTPSTPKAPDSAPSADEQGPAPASASPEDPAHQGSPETPQEPAKSGGKEAGAQPADGNPSPDGTVKLGAENASTGA